MAEVRANFPVKFRRKMSAICIQTVVNPSPDTEQRPVLHVLFRAPAAAEKSPGGVKRMSGRVTAGLGPKDT